MNIRLTRRGWLVLAASLAAGCVSSRPESAAVVESPVFDLPAKDLVRRVARIVSEPPISLPVEDQGDGALLTGWQEPFRGDWHIFRYWHERTRYRVQVFPDFGDPAHRSRIRIVDETEQRPDEGGPNVEARTWHPAPDIHRPERARELLRRIEDRLEAGAVSAH